MNDGHAEVVRFDEELEGPTDNLSKKIHEKYNPYRLCYEPDTIFGNLNLKSN